MIVGLCGFGYSGSGAVADYLKEVGAVRRIPEMEFNIAYMPDGLLDLEYHLCHQHSRFMNGDMAIFRFRDRMTGVAVRKISDPRQRRAFLARMNQYLNALIQVRWTGYSTVWDNRAPKARDPRLNRLSYRARRKLANLLYRQPPEPAEREMYLSINPEDFLGKTRTFVADVLELLGGGAGEGCLLLDQPFPANDPMSVFHYFEDPRAIVVLRDPRDMYALLKHVVNRARFIPIDPVEDFVRYLRILWGDYANSRREAGKVLEVQYEDMIYEYEETTRKINDFLGLRSAKPTREFFDPQVSCVNTRLFERYPEDAEATAYIAENLKDFLYPFEKYPAMTSDAEPF